MKDIRELSLDDFDINPLGSSSSSERGVCDSVYGQESKGRTTQYMADKDNSTASTKVEPPTEDLEIYRKAEHFKRLQLVSGSSIPGSVDEFIKTYYGKEGVVRLKLARHLLSVLNFRQSDDVLLMLSCTKKARVVIATAGAGKTTSLHLDLILSKMMDRVLHNYSLDPVPVEGTEVLMPSILYLNYNKHNVQPIYDRHKLLCAKVNHGIQEKIDDGIESSTVHAFCHKWLRAFAFSVKVPELKIVSDEDKKKLWTAVMTPRWKKFYNEEECGVEWQVMDELYTFKVESMSEWEAFFESAKFVDTGLLPDFVKSCIKKYDSMKKAMGLMDFTDYLVMTIDILKEHKDLRDLVQSRYKIIVADENQDFTALMNELLLQLYNPERNRLIVVGDPDQTIYAFKGVSPDNVVNLVERLEDVEVLGLDTNYRCPDKIVEAAKSILSMNIMRFEKPIKTVRTGGAIVCHPLDSSSLQYKEVLSILSKNGADSYGKTVITYRNNKSSLVIGEELYYANIPFSVLDDRRPFNNMVFRHIQSALTALFEKDDMELNKGLYRFMPVPRETWTRILEENSKLRHHHLHDLIIPDGLPNGTTQAISVLVDISLRIEASPCSDYIGVLIQLYRKYYFDFLMKNPNPAVGDSDYYGLLIDRCVKFWSRPYTFEYMQQELRERNVDKADAVTLSTFHGLKGLEFDYVIAIDFVDSIFPNFFGIEQRYPANTAMEEKESENRLCYVLVTRAVKELHLVYQVNNPSAYIEVLCAKNEENNSMANTISLGGISIPGDAAAAKLNFIQRLTGDRRN